MKAFILGLIIILWPIWLTDLQVDRVSRPREKESTAAAKPKEPAVPPIRLNLVGQIDREVFLTSFARQAGGELVPCLKENGEQSGSVTLIARLLRRQAKLSAFRVLQPSSLRHVTCVEDAINKMRFAAATREMREDSIEISWVFSW